MISQSRWEQIICEVKFVSELHLCITKEELDAVVSVLKNNTPFQVVPDRVADVNLEKNNVVLEAKNFSVLGDKE